MPRLRELGHVVVCALLLLVSLGHAAEREWYEAYHEGLRALESGAAREAASRFEEAIQKRPEPGRNIRTYGTNFEPRYFPFLRLAEARLLLGDLEAAREALERSERSGQAPAEESEALAQRLASLRPPPPPPAPSTPRPAPPTTMPTPTPPPPTTAPSPTPAPTLPPTPEPTQVPRTSPQPVAPSAPASETRAGARPALSQTPEALPATPEEESTATLEVVSDPPGASVYLDDELIGVTDPESGRLVKQGLAPGSHRLRLSVSGHEEGREMFVAGPRASVQRTVRLQPVAGREDLPLSVTAFVTLAVLIVFVVAVWALRQPGRTPSLGTFSPTPARAQMPASSPTPESLPSRFGDYVLLERLGRGGMASVYKAEREGEQFALKRPLPTLAEEPQFLERFRREADIGRTLYHPNIVRIFEQGEVETTPYFTMELIDGETLESRLRRSGTLEPRSAVRCILGVAEALDYAHHKGVIHRDLKPSNIMLPQAGGVKVMDYGIARAQRFEGLTVTGSFLGSPDYVAPEVVDGKAVDARSDLYSLGVVFFEVLTGRRPFAGTTPFSVLKKRLTEEPPSLTEVNPALPTELAELVRQLLSIRAEDRPPNAEALLVELSAYLGERT